MGSDNLTARLANLSPAKRALLELRLKEQSAEGLLMPSIPRRPLGDTAPLSFAQQRLWFLNQLQPENPSYNEPKAVRLTGALDEEALQKALDQIVARHEALRTTFVAVDGTPVQVIAKSRLVDLPVVDLRPSGPDRDAEAQRLLVEATRRPFNLSKDLLLRALLLRLADREHVFLLITHHIASDGWSMGILWRELGELYRAFSRAEPNPLPELLIQYADYAVWQREWLQGEVLNRELSYWKTQLDGIPAVMNLPTDRPRPTVQTCRGARQSIALSEELSQRLKALSRKEGVTLFMTLLAAFQTLLYRYTGQEDIAVGCPIAGRTRQELEGLIGFFVNTLVMRVNFSGNPTIRQLFARVREVALGAYGHQDLPFEKLVEELNPERNLSYTPLFQVAFAYQNTPAHELEISGVGVAPLERILETTKFDLHLSMNDVGDGIGAILYYATELYDDDTMGRLLGHWRVLLEGIADNPDRRLSELPLLTQAEEHELLIEWNDTKQDYPKDKCLHQLFEEQVEGTPDAIAVVFEDQQLTYRELNRRVNQLANHLRKLGVGPEMLVGICLERSLEMVVGLLGILKAGGAYVPLDPQYPKDRLAVMLEDTQIQIILTQERVLGRGIEDKSSEPVLSEVEALDSRVQLVCLDRDWQQIARERDDNPIHKAEAESIVYVIYTSGSTGKPKGVMVHQLALVNVIQAQIRAFGVQPNSRVLQFASLNFDASIFELMMALGAGATLCLGKREDLLPGEPLLQFLLARAITHCTLPPSAIMALPSHPFPLLSTVIVAGEICSAEVVARWAPGRQFWNLYGPTEASIWTTGMEWAQNGHAPPIGKPIANTKIFILDSNLSALPTGVAGELYIGGDGLARGYLNRPELTGETFLPNPFSKEPGARLYKTGDLARYLPDGNIEFLGRIDYQVKIRGFRIELGEIEAVLSQHPAVRETIVLAREEFENPKTETCTEQSRSIQNPKLPEKRLVAYVVLRQEEAVKINELRSFVKQKLPEYMVPSAFVFLDRLPLTSNGKIDRRALPAPDQLRPELEELYVAPHTSVEKKIAEIWAEVLKLDTVGMHDNFFDLGGHSLLATQVMSRVREAFGVDLALRVLFEAPTVGELALRVEHGISNSSELAELARDLNEVESLSDHELEGRLHANTCR